LYFYDQLQVGGMAKKFWHRNPSSVLVCPASPYRGQDPTDYANYSWNAAFGNDAEAPDWPPVRRPKVKRHDSILLAVDGPFRDVFLGQPRVWYYSTYLVVKNQRAIAEPHKAGVNGLFVDGHAGFCPYSDSRLINWPTDPTNGWWAWYNNFWMNKVGNLPPFF
jgi:prepilin-type processing-associated H-X9-DG protein